MKFIDFFAGIGGFRRGMELAGHECVGFCEFDKFAVASYTSMHLITDAQRETLAEIPIKQRQKEILKDEYRNGEWYANDIRSVRSDEIPRADCWCFGFPCQDISIAGKQEGFNGHRSSLFFAVTKLIRDLEEEDRPKYLFIENVKNLLSINRGGDFLKLLIELDEIGYDAEWQLLNSKDFGVPQNRERVFIIGHLRGRSAGEVFPVEGTSTENSISIIGHRDGYRRNTQIFDKNGITEALDTAAGGGRGHHVGLPCFIDMNYGAGIKQTENARTLQARYNKGVNNHSGETTGVAIPVDINCININDNNGKERPQHERIYDTNGVMTALNSQLGGRHNVAVPINIEEDMVLDGNNFNQRKVVHGNGSISRTLIGCGHSGNEPKVAIPILTPDRSEKRQNGRRFKDNGEPMFTLTSQDKHGVGIEVLGGVYTNPSPNYNRGILDGASRTLKADSHPAGVALKIREATKKGYSEAYAGDSINFSVPNSKTRRGIVGRGVAQTLDTSCNQGIFVQVSEELTVYAIWYEKYQCYIAIRKLTPKECFRLQGWTDDYFERAAFVNSDSQLYKQAGNGVTVNVIQAISEKMGSDTN